MHKNKVSIIIPCKNEEENIENTINTITNKISKIDYELIIINDFSNDNTIEVLNKLIKKNNKINVFNNQIRGLGGAINLGIKKSDGEFTSIMMADLSDDPYDLLKYYELIKKEKLDAIFGSRFKKTSKVKNYPKKKLLLNRLFNYFVKIITLSDYNDFTNAFKMYRTELLKKNQPYLSDHFNIFLEIPLKLMFNNCRYKIIPINWSNRKFGTAKFKIDELGSKYFYTLYRLIKDKLFKS